MPSRLWNRVYIERFVDDSYRYYIQLQAACLILGPTCLLMSIMNVFSANWALAAATFGFFAICCFDYYLLKRFGEMRPINCFILEAALFLICTYFMITGGTKGFSTYWIIILPAVVMMLLGRKRGGILTLIVFAMVLFLCWTPWGRSLTTCENFTDVFFMRFPVVFAVASAAGYFFESSRLMTLRQMQKEHEAVRILSETDQLTGLKNRYWFQERLAKITREEKQKNRNAAYLLMDIDGFKHINDTYGHKTGDHVLVAIAAALQEAFHPEDLLCRWGGEEFLAYLPSCDPEMAARAGNVICDLVRNAKVEDDEGKPFKVTISVGVVVIPGDVVVDVSRAFIEADKQLYTAKNNGRDQVSIKIMA